MDLRTRGLVLRAVDYKEADKILTVLTEDAGRLTVSARGARSKRSKFTATSQLLAFSELDLQERYGRWYLKEGRAVELFSGLRQDIVALSVGAYFAELLEAVSDMDYDDPGLLHLGLTGLHVLSGGTRDPMLVKAAFELRLMCLSGYTPEVGACPKCGAGDPQSPMLSLRAGHIHCGKHHPDGGGASLSLDQGSLSALRHIVSAPENRVFAFALGTEGMAHLTSLAEGYVLAQLERRFRTLDFLKQL